MRYCVVDARRIATSQDVRLQLAPGSCKRGESEERVGVSNQRLREAAHHVVRIMRGEEVDVCQEEVRRAHSRDSFVPQAAGVCVRKRERERREREGKAIEGERWDTNTNTNTNTHALIG